MSLVRPHGGRLVSRLAPAEGVEDLRALAARLPRIDLTRRELCDLELIATGALSPLEGFVGREDFTSIVERRRLASGLPFTLPITLAVAEEPSGPAGLWWEGRLLGRIDVRDVFEYPREAEAERVYGTRDPAHLGVRTALDREPFLVGGPVTLFERQFPDSLTPAEVRGEFERRGWSRVAAFQTRNPIHRAHEYLTKVALEMSDGLLIHPLVGETKSDDIPAEVRLRAYDVLLEKYYPKGRVFLSTLPASMRYAGPREAIVHAILRQNYGASHFIVGRDHAGVGKYYGPFDAQRIFDELPLDIAPLRFDNTFWCLKCSGLASAKTCPHAPESRLSLSGTQVREKLARGEGLPEEFTRPEVAEVLREYYSRLEPVTP